MHKKYVPFECIQSLTKKLYAYALLKCESGNQKDTAVLVNELYEYLIEEERKFDEIPNLSTFDNQINDYTEIVKSRVKSHRKIPKPNKDLLPDKMSGAILGRFAGCTLGVPVESWHSEDMEEMAKQFGDDFPPTNYWTKVYYPHHKLHHGLSIQKSYTRDHMNGVPIDDDIGYTILNLLVLEKYGKEFTTENVADVWIKHLPFAHSAEKIALENLKRGILAEKAGETQNPFTEWIGGYIRSDAWAWASPGNPDKAAELAWRDAYLTHRGNGIYAAMFFAAVESAAFCVDGIEEAILIGLEMIPPKCRLAEDIRWALAISGNIQNWKDVVIAVNGRFKGMSRVNANNNACLVILGLLIGKKDFSTTIGNIVAMGYDNDCNAATAGSILGAMIGKKNIPEHWYKPFCNTIHSYIIGSEKLELDHFIRRFLVQAGKE